MRIGASVFVTALSVMALGVLRAAPGSATPVANTGSIVVNEIAAGAYVELRNVSPSTVDIGGFNLWLCDAGDVVSHLRLAIGRQLHPGGFYVLASSSFTGGVADQTYSGVLPRGGAVLLDPGYGWVDGVSVDRRSPCGTGDPAPACPFAGTARDLDSTNTGNNAADFSCRTMSPGEPNY